MDPSPVPISEFVKSAPFWKEHPTSLPTAEEITAFVKSVDTKVYSYTDVVAALLVALREHMTANVPVGPLTLEAYESLAKALQEIVVETVASVKDDLKDVVVAVQDGVKDASAGVAEIRAADSATDAAVGTSKVVEAVAETTAKVADEVQDAAKKIAEATDAAEKAAIAAGLDEKKVKDVTDKVEAAAAAVADAADKAEDVAKKVDKAMDVVQAMAPAVEQVEQQCCLVWGRMRGLCKKKTPPPVEPAKTS
jgi:methyl-accepting chemotaxis protein